METRREERQKDEKEDLEVSDLPSTKPKGIYEMRSSIYKVRDRQMEADRGGGGDDLSGILKKRG